MEIDIQVLMEKMKVELGSLVMNNLTLNIQVEKLNELLIARDTQIRSDQELIENLRQHGSENERALAELRKIAHPQNTRKLKE